MFVARTSSKRPVYTIYFAASTPLGIAAADYAARVTNNVWFVEADIRMHKTIQLIAWLSGRDVILEFPETMYPSSI